MSGDSKQSNGSGAKKVDESTWQTEGLACLECATVLDRHLEVGDRSGDRGPTPGALALCCSCGTLMQYQEDETVLVEKRRLKFVLFDVDGVEDQTERNKLKRMLEMFVVVKVEQEIEKTYERGCLS